MDTERSSVEAVMGDPRDPVTLPPCPSLSGLSPLRSAASRLASSARRARPDPAPVFLIQVDHGSSIEQVDGRQVRSEISG